MNKFLRKNKAYLLIGYALLLFVHFGFKDHFYITGIIFYAFPLPVLILILIIILILIYSEKKVFKILLFLLLILSIFWIKNYYFSYKTSEPIEGENTFLFWNVNKQKDFNIKILKEITDHQNIETIILIEAYHKKSTFKTEFQNQLKGYNVKYLKSDMIVASKKKINSLDYLYSNLNLKLNYINIGTKDKFTTFAIIDVFGSPTHNRDDALSRIINFTTQSNVDVILGDFNTPYESVHFNKFKTNYQSFRKYQNGFSSTWPYGFPLLELDQIWLKANLKPIKLEKVYKEESDHAILIGKFKTN